MSSFGLTSLICALGVTDFAGRLGLAAGTALGYIVDRDPRTIMYHENDGQHPSLNAFYQMVTMFGISVDEYFYPNMGADEAAKKRINILLNSLNESELRLVEGIINAIIENHGTEGA